MKQLIAIIIIAGTNYIANAQLYFPPINSSNWDTMHPSRLDWCQEKIDSLYNFLDNNESKAFILLKDGKIVLEKYFNGHTASSNWYWASAGKTITSFMVGIAQEENYLNISDTSSKYLGQGWTDCTPTQEDKITIWHQLTMTSGLDDGVADPFCTIDTCMIYKADAGTRWAYHNAPYTLLDQVIQSATGISLNNYTNQKLKAPTGMTGVFTMVDFNNVFFSTARSMARFGLLILNKGVWNGTVVLSDTSYFNQMINTSQQLNKSYGYLWWLNGKSSFMIPQSQVVIPGSMSVNGPNDAIMALGKDGQIINVVSSENLVWIRMGQSSDGGLVSANLNDDIWSYINDLSCTTVSAEEPEKEKLKIIAYPNPVVDDIWINLSDKQTYSKFEICNYHGQVILKGNVQSKIDVSSLSSGVYFLSVFNGNNSETIKLIKR